MFGSNKKVETENLIEEKSRRLKELQNRSTSALDIVTSTIGSLKAVNSEIDTVISEIIVAKTELENTEEDLQKTKNNNEAIINKFMNLISFE